LLNKAIKIQEKPPNVLPMFYLKFVSLGNKIGVYGYYTIIFNEKTK